METATSLAISQFSDYLRGLTQRLDPGAGWYGEFLRRDPEGVRACLQGAAMAPWDVVESLLRDLAGLRGEEFAAREGAYAAGLRAAAVGAWDRLPGGTEELRTLLTTADTQRAEADAALRSLSARRAGATDRAEADVLDRELSWTRDDAARAAARYEDLSARLAAATRPAGPGQDGPPLPGVPRQRVAERPQPLVARPQQAAPVTTPAGAAAPAPEPEAPEPEPPVGRAEGRWLRTGRRAGGARYAGAAPSGAADFTPPPGYEAQAPAAGPDPVRAAPRGARFGHPAPTAAPAPAPSPSSSPSPAGARPTGAFVAELLTLRARGRTGEAHVLLCEAAAWPAGRLPGLAAELTRAGLAADWATLLWEAASLPPERLAAAAAALGEAGREADSDALLRQGVARPTAEIADAALALGGAGHTREAEALLGAFVRVRTAEEAARLAGRDPQWLAPRLLDAARALSGPRHRDLVHALRVAGIAMA
ncbi:hypothetical protein ACWGF3_18045 [Streptomyces xanthophaeus]|uniref:UL36 very large tegument protein n=1 Tax=Streptomyces xanthophaeus TaxID=67385 RepID=A0A919LJF7_9ACTN|nr:hypothetical protein [Streptomyces xanthophaeus]GHI86464.1 hypothetical protein Sxan_38280 [Streptomyces xanthophaeus]